MTQTLSDPAAAPAPRRRGRPTKSQGEVESTRTLIVRSAAEEFGRGGFDATSMRAIAREAGVDPALVRHYFSDKAQLFSEAIAAPMRPDQLVRRALDGSPEEMGANLVRYIVSTLDEPGVSDRIVRMMHTAMTQEFAAELFREFLMRAVLTPIAQSVSEHDVDQRASFAAAQVIGLVMARYATPIEPMASATTDEVVAQIGPVLQWLLLGGSLHPADSTLIFASTEE
jgi:AcrR family transcriptional regulator